MRKDSCNSLAMCDVLLCCFTLPRLTPISVYHFKDHTILRKAIFDANSKHQVCAYPRFHFLTSMLPAPQNFSTPRVRKNNARNACYVVGHNSTCCNLFLNV